MTSEQIANLFFNLIDIRNALSQNALETFIDEDGTELTVADLLDDVIEALKTAQEAL